MNEVNATEAVTDGVQISRFLNHVKDPQNLLNYMIFTAYCKFMGISSYLPSITIG